MEMKGPNKILLVNGGRMEARLSDIPKDEVLRYLGYRGQSIDDNLKKQIENCIKAVKDCAKARLTYRVLPVKDSTIDGLELEGNDIRKLLEGCHLAIAMAATLGPEAEALLRRTEVTNMADAVIMDSAQSSAIENVCDNFESDVRLEYRKQGLYLTDRYSPGYGDLPLTSQKTIAELLVAEKRIGLTVTENMIMIPRKSVTCIIGISDKPRTLVRRGCDSCSSRDKCSYRAQGSVCNA
jgi:hypothetical protein